MSLSNPSPPSSPSPPPPSSPLSARDQAEYLACSTLSALNDSISASNDTQISPLLSLLYSPTVSLSISAVAPTPPHVLLTESASFADAVAALADIGLLGAHFDAPAVTRSTYIPMRIALSTAGVLRPRDGGTVRYAREIILCWGCPHVTEPAAVSPAGWHVIEDHLILYA